MAGRRVAPVSFSFLLTNEGAPGPSPLGTGEAQTSTDRDCFRAFWPNHRQSGQNSSRAAAVSFAPLRRRLERDLTIPQPTPTHSHSYVFKQPPTDPHDM